MDNPRTSQLIILKLWPCKVGSLPSRLGSLWSPCEILRDSANNGSPAALSFKEEIKEIPLLHLRHKRKWFSQQRGPQLALIKKTKMSVNVGESGL